MLDASDNAMLEFISRTVPFAVVIEAPESLKLLNDPDDMFPVHDMLPSHDMFPVHDRFPFVSFISPSVNVILPFVNVRELPPSPFPNITTELLKVVVDVIGYSNET